MLRSRWWWVPFVLPMLAAPFPLHNAQPDAIRCTTGDSIPTSVVTGRFHVFRPGTRGQDLVWRDLEFMWDATYPGGLSLDAQNTLKNFASMFVDSTGHNPFGAGLSKIRLDYNFFSDSAASYSSTDALDSTSMALRRGTAGYTNADRSHADVYLEFNGPNKWVPDYNEAAEDTSTGHLVNLLQSELTDVQPNNALALGGPGPGFHIDSTGSGWTHPDSSIAQGFVHEFEHHVDPTRIDGGVMMDELFAQAAEAICGTIGKNTRDEVPFTWPLFYIHNLTCPNCCVDPRGSVLSNYFGRGLFTAYLAYNFRGADTLATALGLNDDLLRRWSRHPVFTPSGWYSRHWGKLVELLGDDSCGSCVGKNYFRVGKNPLPKYDRAQLLLHNWRVANYVNRFDLPGTEGQYGFPPRFGVSPGGTFKAWQAFDGCDSDDVVSIPPVITLTSGNVSQEMLLRVKREFRGNWHPLSLKPTGAEYWVIRADTASLGQTPRDLVITVSSDSVFRQGVGQQFAHHFDGRLMASVVGYTHRAPDAVESPQWANPQWATLALAPKWVDADSLPAEMQFVVSGFGTGYTAAVLVITLGDGPSRMLEDTVSTLPENGYAGVGGQFKLPYRVSLALRGAPNDTLPNPRGLQQDSTTVADQAAWSPASDEVAFTRTPASGAARIYPASRWFERFPALHRNRSPELPRLVPAG